MIVKWSCSPATARRRRSACSRPWRRSIAAWIFTISVTTTKSYGNTGFQSSPSTPYGARTATEPITPSSPHGRLHERRDCLKSGASRSRITWRRSRPLIHSIFRKKFFAQRKFTGPKLFIALSPCPPGWEVDPEWSIEIARLAVETGIWPLKEAIHGAVSHTYVPRKFEPVEEYLKRQGRFRHLFEPKRDDETIAHIQATAWIRLLAVRDTGGPRRAPPPLPRNAGMMKAGSR